MELQTQISIGLVVKNPIVDDPEGGRDPKGRKGGLIRDLISIQRTKKELQTEYFNHIGFRVRYPNS